jgi:CheY-like chemotaxis protein
MSLQALVLCSDETIMRVLRRVLSDLEISVEQCTTADSAVRQLTRQRFEAVVVDCSDEDAAASVLRSVRSAPCNKHAVAVAIIDGQKAVRSAFALGAHFVLYKPVSAERARTSFRAARAMMKVERRRNTRVAIEIPVVLNLGNGAGQQKATTADLSEGGMAVYMARRAQQSGAFGIKFTLPGTECVIECSGEVAWENGGSQAGIRFVSLAPELRTQLKSWLARHSPEIEKEDPPVPCKLTDLSLGGCYLEAATPFPAGTRVALSMRIAEIQVRAEGVVRVMHPETGMGVEFTRATGQQREQVEKLIQALMNSQGGLPELVVEPEGMSDPEPAAPVQPVADETEDPLLDLFRRKTEFTTESFLSELRRQRGSHPEPAQAAVSA